MKTEDLLSKEDNPEMRAMQAGVGIARYTGQKEVSIDRILSLAAVKFSRMQTTPPPSST